MLPFGTLILLFVGCGFSSYQWSWVGGNTDSNTPTSSFPGSRRSPLIWRDSLGNTWLFGGEGIDIAYKTGYLNDLWVTQNNGFSWKPKSGSLSANQIGIYGTVGVGSLGNTPGSRTEAAHWIDQNDNLWLFGGFGFGSNSTAGYLNDLWMWNGTIWTWMGGSSSINDRGVFNKAINSLSIPSARASVATRNINNNAYLFGGNGYDSLGEYGNLNDLWKFDGNVWSWLSGSSIIPDEFGPVGYYGTQGQANPINTPGGRNEHDLLSDASGNIWLFGGSTENETFEASFNDLWMFNVSSLQWTWIAGNNTINQPGVYQSQGIADYKSFPGARSQHCVWVDTSGIIFLFGGSLYLNQIGTAYLNDLWSFNVTSLSWTWITGSNSVNQPGSYGIFAEPSLSNTPGARSEHSCWSDSINLYLFGGYGISYSQQAEFFDDAWRLEQVSIPTIQSTTQINQSMSSSSIYLSTSPLHLPSTTDSLLGIKVGIPVAITFGIIIALAIAIIYWRRRKLNNSFGGLKESDVELKS